MRNILRYFKISLSFNFFLYVVLLKQIVSANQNEISGGDDKPVGRYQVAKLNFDHVSDVYAITLWILLGSLAKVGFHMSHKLTKRFPESCLLMILGLIVGAILYRTKLSSQKAYVLNSDTFFLFLLPPIILEAGFFMPNRPFFNNIGTILLFAIANTFFNTLLIGFTIWAFSYTPLYGGTEFEMLHCFVFSALISAVDPVAVLATFVEIHVNDMLYIIVFGESLLNDAVSVVLYRMFDSFAEMGTENILPVDIVLGGVSFIIVAGGGVLIGICFGIVACYTTKFTSQAPILEPLIIIIYSYLSYLTAELFSTSGILAITFCGMFMKQYVEFNIAKKSNSSIEYILKMTASIMETIIFMFMGLSTVSDEHSWNTGFVVITILSCTIYRMIGVIIFANLANKWRLVKLRSTDMLIMSYGGIRGAVAFALALILDENIIPRKKEFVTATISVVFFTVFIQGSTIGPIVKYFEIKCKEFEEPTMMAKLSNRMVDYVMSCLEDLSGVSGKHSLRDKIRTYDRDFIKPILLRDKNLAKDIKLMSTLQKINELNVNRMAEDPIFVLPSNQTYSKLPNFDKNSLQKFIDINQSDVYLPKIKIIKTDSFTDLNDNGCIEFLNDAIIDDQPRNVKRYRKLSHFEDELDDAQNKLFTRSRSTRTQNQSRKQSFINDMFLRPKAKSISDESDVRKRKQILNNNYKHLKPNNNVRPLFNINFGYDEDQNVKFNSNIIESASSKTSSKNASVKYDLSEQF